MATTRTTLLSEVEHVYRTVRGGVRTLHPDDLLEDDLGIDSLVAMEMLVVLENRHGVELIGDERTARVRTVADLVDLLVHLGATEARQELHLVSDSPCEEDER